MQKILNNFNFFLNLFECVDFKNIFYKFIISPILAGKIVKNRYGFSLLKVLNVWYARFTRDVTGGRITTVSKGKQQWNSLF